MKNRLPRNLKKKWKNSPIYYSEGQLYSVFVNRLSNTESARLVEVYKNGINIKVVDDGIQKRGVTFESKCSADKMNFVSRVRFAGEKLNEEQLDSFRNYGKQ